MNYNCNSSICVIFTKNKRLKWTFLATVVLTADKCSLTTGIGRLCYAQWRFLISACHCDQFAPNDKITAGKKALWEGMLVFYSQGKGYSPCSSCLPLITCVPKLWLYFTQAAKKLSSCKVPSGALLPHTSVQYQGLLDLGLQLCPQNTARWYQISLLDSTQGKLKFWLKKQNFQLPQVVSAHTQMFGVLFFCLFVLKSICIP